MKMEISSLARLIPGHMRCPLPNPRKLKGFRGSCILFNNYLFPNVIVSESNKKLKGLVKKVLTSNLEGSNF